MIVKFVQASVLVLLLSSCLKTRSEVSGQDQEYLYGQKHADNQMAEVQSNNIPAQETAVETTAVIDDKDELIRTLNGRVETLEHQLATLTQEKEQSATAENEKIVLLQEALAKMELQIQRLENELPLNKTNDQVVENLDEVAKTEEQVETKKLGAYESAQQFFANKEWKKAILNFQKYTDESPKGKNVADAKYKIGVSFQELGMKEEAMAFYEEVVANYSKTEAGKSAKARLAKLKK